MCRMKEKNSRKRKNKQRSGVRNKTRRSFVGGEAESGFCSSRAGQAACSGDAACSAAACGGTLRSGILEKYQKGFGFVRQEEGGDIFIGRDNMLGAMNGDLVEVDLLPPYLWEQSRGGIVTKILERHTTEVVGTFRKNRSFGLVVPDDKKVGEDIFVRKEFCRGAASGDKVVAKITKYPDKFGGAEGKITEIVARKDQVGSEVLSMIRAKGLFETFPSRCNAEAKARSKEEITEEILRGRLDLRGKTVITVDGASAKDLDDAISVEILPNGNYLLGVHIADVSHFVDEDGYLDREALKRGTSVYLLNRVVPMLPKLLSNGVCSLNEGKDRLTLSCIMEIDAGGNVVSHEICESVICSKARMVYDDVSDLLEYGMDLPKSDAEAEAEQKSAKFGQTEYPEHIEELRQKYDFLLNELYTMGELAQILRHRRKQRGSIDFDVAETEILLDEQEKPIEIRPAERRVANRMIEEFMLVANETVAEQFFWLQYPFLYRVHEKPEAEKMMELKAYLMNFGIHLKGSADTINPKTLADIISQLEGKPYETLVNRVMLRTMKKAYYSTECDGHFGLAFRYYCHFTSPIRRYPDLFIHRVIKQQLQEKMTEAKLEKYRIDALNAAEISSRTERQAQELERDVEKLKKCEYMLEHIGEEYDAVVSGVTEFGVYAELPNTVEGMAFARTLRRSYALGEKVKIRVLDARPSERQIDFEILEEENL